MRCILVNLNQESIPSGALVRLLIVLHVDARPNTYTVRFSNLVASTPEGQASSLTAKPFKIEVKPRDLLPSICSLLAF